MSFSTLGLTPSICAPLPALGHHHPTAVQSAAIPLVLTGVDLLARAQTGTGKTAAFALPMIEHLLVRRVVAPRQPRGLVLVPTRELAVQVHNALRQYGSAMHVRVTAIFGGVAMGRQIAALKKGTHIVVATPGRLIDHLQRRTIDLSAIELLALDEADRMLDMGFLPSLRRIALALPARRQTLLFSATMSPEVVQLSSEFTRNPARVDASTDKPVAPTITHRLVAVAADRKRELLARVLVQPPAGQSLVFCNTKRGADRVGDYLAAAGFATAVIHGDKSQGRRTKALADFNAGGVAVLVATDVAARGLDIVQLPLVVNYDLPSVAEDYIHRIGRTGRAGYAGRAVSLVTAQDRDRIRDIQRLLPEPLEQVVLPGFETPRDNAPRELRSTTRSAASGRWRHRRRSW